MPIILRFVSLALLLIAAILNSACSESKPPLRVALLEWPPYELAFWAREQGWLNPEQIKLLEYKTPAEVARAFASGSVDIIAVTTDFALSLAHQYPDTRIFLVIDASNGGDVVLSRAPVNDPADLKGKRIAVEAGPLGSYMLTRFRDHFGLDKADLSIDYVDIPAQVDHWRNTDVDLLITYEPNRSRVLDLGATEVFSSRQIPNEIVDVFLVRQATLDHRQEALQHMVEAWFKAVADLKAAKPALFEFIGQRESIPATVVKEALLEQILVPDRTKNMRLLSGQDPSFLDGLERNENSMRSAGIIGGAVDRQSLVTHKLLYQRP